MAVEANVILGHAGTIASIQAGFSRATNLDGREPYGAAAGADGGTAGGAATHFQHTIGQHRHTFSGGVCNGVDNRCAIGTSKGYSHPNHTHASTNGAYTTPTLGTASNWPAYKEILFIKSGGTNDVGNLTYFWWDSASLPAGCQEADGTNGTTDYRNKHIKGAEPGAEIGADGGSNTHTHTSTHSHAATNAAAGSTTTSTGTGRNVSTGNHLHAVTMTDASANVGTDAAEPPYRKLLTIVNVSGGEIPMPIGGIGIHEGSVATIPANWARYSNQDSKFLKSASGVGEIGDTGGSTTHTHTASAHTHPTTATGGACTQADIDVASLASCGHTHTWTVSNETISVGANSDEGLPPYLTVIFIKYLGSSFNPSYQTWTP